MILTVCVGAILGGMTGYAVVEAVESCFLLGKTRKETSMLALELENAKRVAKELQAERDSLEFQEFVKAFEKKKEEASKFDTDYRRLIRTAEHLCNE